MRWRSYWPRHDGDYLPYNTLGVLLSAKKIHTYVTICEKKMTTGPVTTATNERLFSPLQKKFR